MHLHRQLRAPPTQRFLLSWFGPVCPRRQTCNSHGGENGQAFTQAGGDAARSVASGSGRFNRDNRQIQEGGPRADLLVRVSHNPRRPSLHKAGASIGCCLSPLDGHQHPLCRHPPPPPRLPPPLAVVYLPCQPTCCSALLQVQRGDRRDGMDVSIPSAVTSVRSVLATEMHGPHCWLRGVLTPTLHAQRTVLPAPSPAPTSYQCCHSMHASVPGEHAIVCM